MADLNFVYNNDCSDVNITTPTVDYNYIEYMSKKSTKDFYNIKNYKIVYSKDCGNLVSETTTLVPPNYNLDVTIDSCTLSLTSTGLFKFKLTGINPDFVSTIEACDVTFTTCFATPVIKKPGYSVFDIFVPLNGVTPSTQYFKLTTVDGFEYRMTFVLTLTGSTNCDYTLSNFTFTYDLPTYLNTPTSEIDLNVLYNQNNLDPGYYDIKICETSAVTEVCLQNKKFIDCELFTCPESFTCDPTDDNCQLMLDVLKKHQSLEYGLVCCGDYSQNILRFYIKLYCPTELNC